MWYGKKEHRCWLVRIALNEADVAALKPDVRILQQSILNLLQRAGIQFALQHGSQLHGDLLPRRTNTMHRKQNAMGTMLAHFLHPSGPMCRDVGQHRFVRAMQPHVHHISVALFVHVHVGTIPDRQTLEAEAKCFEA